MIQDCIQCLVDSTYLQLDGSSCSTATYRLLLEYLYFCWFDIDTDIIYGIIGTLSILTIVINDNSKIRVILYTRFLLNDNFTINLIPFSLG